VSYFIRIFCQSTQDVRRRELQEFILGGIHFDKHPVFIPAFLDPDSMLDNWERVDIIYEQDKRPVWVYRNVGDSLLEGGICEVKI